MSPALLLALLLAACLIGPTPGLDLLIMAPCLVILALDWIAGRDL